MRITPTSVERFTYLRLLPQTPSSPPWSSWEAWKQGASLHGGTRLTASQQPSLPRSEPLRPEPGNSASLPSVGRELTPSTIT